MPPASLSGTIQNDILKEYIARGTYIYPPRASLRIVTDIFAYCDRELPNWNTISISGYHIREAGSTAVQEVAFTLANAIAYVQAALDAGLDVDRLGQRLSFFFNAHNDFIEEIAKFRAARRLWAHVMRDRFGATNPRAQQLRFHTQTAGSTLTAQQPDNNIVRVADSGARRGARRHAVAPLQRPRRGAGAPDRGIRADRAADAADHRVGERRRQYRGSGGRLVSRSRRRRIGSSAMPRALIERIDGLGGTLAAIEAGFIQREIQDAAYSAQQEIDAGARVVVGVNRYAVDGGEPSIETLRIDPDIETRQVERVRRIRSARDHARWRSALDAVGTAARGRDNLMPPILAAVEAQATVGEIADAMRAVFGEHREADVPIADGRWPIGPATRKARRSSVIGHRSPRCSRSNISPSCSAAAGPRSSPSTT